MSFSVGGVTYQVTHLATSTHDKVPMQDSRGTVFQKPVLAVYSPHCYSIGDKSHKGVPFNPAPGALFWDGARKRAFDLTRYNLSLVLPQIVEGMLYSPHAMVWDAMTGRGNRHYSELIGSPNIDSGHPYYVFMQAKKDKIENGPRVIKLVIESAYVVRPPNPLPKQKAMLPMREWLGRTWENK